MNRASRYGMWRKAAYPVRNKRLRWVSIPVERAVLFRKNERSGGCVASDGADQGGGVTFLEDSKFFFTLYHAGRVNIILHVVRRPHA